MIIAKFIAVIIVGYILGSIPFGLWITRHKTTLDVRQHGSGKTGATNVLRTAGGKLAALVAFLDIVKGVLAVVFAGLMMGNDYFMIGSYTVGILTAQVAGALAAIAGHNLSIFLHFHGGRGVATFLGGLIALYPVAGAFGSEILIVVAGLSGFASLGSIAGAVGAYALMIPLAIMHGLPLEYLIYALIGAIIIIVSHRSNIRRLISGTERKLSRKAELRSLPKPRLRFRKPQADSMG